jgi:hypothetical protein
MVYYLVLKLEYYLEHYLVVQKAVLRVVNLVDLKVVQMALRLGSQ